MMLNTFSCTAGYLYVFFGEMSIQKYFVYFYFIFDIDTLSDISFTNIFSHSVGCSFPLWIVAFTVQKLFILMWFHLPIFVFVTCAFGVTMESLPRTML